MKLIVPLPDDGFIPRMPPTRGHDLKLDAKEPSNSNSGCPPHGGTT